MGNLVTTSLVLTDDQQRLLKNVAAVRMMRGQQQTASVSEVVRDLIERNAPALQAEIEGAKK
jgi:hypothetical protein